MSREVPAVSKTAVAASSAPSPKIRVAFILTPHFTLTAFAGFVDVLRLAADDADRSRQLDCQWTVLGEPGAAIASSAGAEVRAWEPMERPERFDYIVVVGGLLHQAQRVPNAVYTFLKQAAKAGVALVGLCTGSFVLARAGLLDGHVTCVSWFHRDDFTRAFPRLRLVTNQMYVIDRDRMTCAGGTSVVHLAAHLVEKHCGRAFANKSLRILLEDQPLPSNTPQPEAEITRKAQDWSVRRAMLLIEQKLSSSEPIHEVVGSLGVGIRQLERRFNSDVGMTMREFRSRLRLARAKWMIENTDLSLTHIGLECGFGGCSHFSRAFAAHFKVRPSAVRRSVQPALGRRAG
jgi:transcriptional regulator GlxA family with amidase domain